MHRLHAYGRAGSLTVAGALALGLVVAACGGSSATPTPAPTVVPTAAAPSPSPAPVASAPAATLGPVSSPVASVPAASGPAGSPGASPAPTPPDLGVSPDRTLPPGQVLWPTSVIDATIALAAADNEFKKAAGDWTTGAEAKDMDLLLAAAQGMSYLADRSMANAQRLADFPELATVGKDLVDVFSVLRVAGQQVNDTAVAGDTPGFEAAVADLAAAMAAYGTAREPMIDAAELALVMRRGLLVK